MHTVQAVNCAVILAYAVVFQKVSSEDGLTKNTDIFGFHYI